MKQDFEVVDPATLETIATCPDGGEQEARGAVEAASKALPEWRAFSVQQRATLLQRLATALENEADFFADLLVAESGKPQSEAQLEVSSSAGYLRWNAEEGKRCYGRIVGSSRPGVRAWTVLQPVGVVAAITPWNYPLNTLCRKLAPALAAGCTVVVKPAAETPLSTLELEKRVASAGIPSGVLNVVTTSRADDVVGVWLRDPRVRKIGFTGSTGVGMHLFRESAATLKRVSLELGGHAPALVFRDADLEQAADAIVASRFRHAGQTCVCAQRVYVEAPAADELLILLKQRIERLRVGNGKHTGVNMGPLIHAGALQRVTEHVQDAIERGGVLVTGGERLQLSDPDRGYFFQPTLLDSVSETMRVMKEETFGPVLTFSRFSGEGEAIKMANSTPFGLVAYVFTKDAGRALRLIDQLEFGVVGVNETGIVQPDLPFGGLKHSGMGKENGVEGILEYLEVKSAVARMAAS